MLTSEEVEALAKSVLGLDPDQPAADVVRTLAAELAGLPSWPACAEGELESHLRDCLARRTDPMAQFSLGDALAWKAQREGRSEDDVGMEVVDALLTRTGVPWLQVRWSAVPEEAKSTITRLGTPASDVSARFFPEHRLRGVDEVAISADLNEVTVVRVYPGFPRKALAQWHVYEAALQRAATDGLGPVIPSFLLEQSSNQPEGTSEDATAPPS